MKNILTIFKKEWDRVIRDRRLVIMVILMPGVLIYMIYSFMGSMMINSETPLVDVAVLNLPSGFSDIYSEVEDDTTINVVEITNEEILEYQTLIDDKDWSILIVFPEDIESYSGVGEKPEVYLYFNPNDSKSGNAYARFSSYLTTYQTELSYDLYGDTNFFLLNQSQTPFNNSEIMGTIFGQLLPMLTIMFLFSGAMSIGPEAIAGEKERGTIATILITPIKRRELALGKILGLSALALLSAVSSFLGIILSLPKLINYEGADISIYGFNDYLLILLVLFSTIFVIIGIISILSAFSKSVKEAGSYIAPIYILTIIIAIGTSFGGFTNPSLFLFALPIYNSVESLKAIMTFSDNALIYTLITVIANLVYLVIFVGLLNKMFNSEKIMFAK